MSRIMNFIGENRWQISYMVKIQSWMKFQATMYEICHSADILLQGHFLLPAIEVFGAAFQQFLLLAFSSL